jgi:hypothetical protein
MDRRAAEARMGPPPEAIEACKGKTEGDAVEFTTPRGEKIKATCELMGGQMAAVPEGFQGSETQQSGKRQNGE